MADYFCTCSRPLARAANSWMLSPVVITCSLPDIHTSLTPATFFDRIKHMSISPENGACLPVYKDTY